MEIKDIAMIVVGCFLALLYIALVIISIVKKRKQGQSIDVVQAMAEVAQDALPLIKVGEIAFKCLASEKTGTLKLKNFLNDVKDLCAEKGIKFDKTYWTNFATKAVDLINIDRIEDKDNIDENTEEKIADTRTVATNHKC